MPWARVFFVCGGPQKATWAAGDGPAADGSRVMRANGCGQSNTRGAARERYAGKERKVFLFLGENRRVVVLFWLEAEAGAQLLRFWGIGAAAKTSWTAARGEKPSL